jgi:hypothetical protein
VLVDFSQFAPGTQIILINAGSDPNTVGTVMRFVVQNTPAISPPALPLSLFPARPALPTDAPLRIKSFHNHIDADGNAQRSVDGLTFTSPPTEFPLVGSTEQWDLVNVGGGGHQIHLHLIEFQVVSRQAIDTAAYNEQWTLLNGFRPVTRPIVVDPTPFLIGSPVPALPYETGWKDTVRAPSGQLTRIIARWAPQEVVTGGVAPGQNKFPIDPQFPPSVDTFSGPGYVWHCHVLGHEDHDMMRQLAIIKKWETDVKYPVGRVVSFNNINYRVREAHTSKASRSPTARFDLWERVNNNEGSWQPQIIYAIGDRVLHNGQLFEALHVHQAQAGQTPPDNPELWELLPLTACEQLIHFTEPHLGTDPRADEFYAIGLAGDEAACRAVLAEAMAIFQHAHARPCSGLSEDPIVFTVPDEDTFLSTPDKKTVYYETLSQLKQITVSNSSHRGSDGKVTVNGREMKKGVNYPLPPQRNHGYCIETSGGATFKAE